LAEKWIVHRNSLHAFRFKAILFLNKFGNAMKKSLDELSRFREPLGKK